MEKRLFFFWYDFDSYEISRQPDGQYVFSVELNYSIRQFPSLRRDSCRCSEFILRKAIDLVNAHFLSRIDLLPPSISWDDAPIRGEYLQLEYHINGISFSLYGDDGFVAATPYVDRNHLLYSEVIQASRDLLLLFLECK